MCRLAWDTQGSCSAQVNLAGLRNLQTEMCRCSFPTLLPICALVTTDEVLSFYFPFLQLWFDFSCRADLAGGYEHPEKIQLPFRKGTWSQSCRRRPCLCSWQEGPYLSLLGENSSFPEDGDEGQGALGLNGND